VERVSACGETQSTLSAVVAGIAAVPLPIKFSIALCSLLSISKIVMHLNWNGSACGSPLVKVGLVPFAGAVNVGTNNVASGGTGTSDLIPIHSKDTDLLAGHALPSPVNYLKVLGGGGCLNAGVRTHGHDLIDEPPDPLVSVRRVFRTGRTGLRKLGGFAGADFIAMPI
jgi:hypothetical protein